MLAKEIADKTVSERTWRNPAVIGRVVELDGLRGLAILLVVIQHYVRERAHPAVGSWLYYALATLRFSWSGVDLFFVLSGFLIGGILLDVKNARNYYPTFYLRRIHRIFPLYYLLLALFSIALFLGSDITKPGTFGLSHVALWSYPLFLQNIMMSITNNWATGWVSPTWSLAIEEQFYLLLPIAIRYFSRRGIWCTVVAAIFCAPVIRMGILLSGGGNIGPRALLPCRADALGFGVLAALAIRDEFLWNWLNTHRRMMYAAFSVLGLGVLALLTTVSGGSFFFIAVGYSWLAAFYTVLLLLLVVKPGRAERIAFRSTPLVGLGIVSYAVYVFHVPVNSLWHRAVFGSAPSFDNWSSILVTLLSVITTLLLAALSWRVLEKPLIRRAHAKFRYETAQA